MIILDGVYRIEQGCLENEDEIGELFVFVNFLVHQPVFYFTYLMSL